MKLNRLETHDRLIEYSKQSNEISEMCQKIMNERPFGEYDFYIFAHTRTVGLDEKIAIYNDDLQQSICNMSYKRKYYDLRKVPEKRLIWQPRLTKPKAQVNSMLFKAYPKTDLVKIIWMIPAREMWDQYQKGNMTESETVIYSINMYMNKREELELPEPDDLPDHKIDAIYRSISLEHKPRQWI